MSENIHISITHYDRWESLWALISQIREQLPTANITVFDDGSDAYTGSKKSEEKFDFVPCVHHGKEKYWQLWQYIIEYIPRADRYYFLPDDVSITPEFFNELPQIKGPAVFNLLNDKGRCGKPNWTEKHATIHDRDWLNTDWFDLCGAMNREAVEILKSKQFGAVYPKRWHRAGHLGSGVGQNISYRLRENGAQFFQTRHKLLTHNNGPSKMNPNERKENPIVTWEMPPIIAGMATIPGREEQCRRAVESILPFVDEFWLVYNGEWEDPLTDPIYGSDGPKKLNIVISNNSKGDGEKLCGFSARMIPHVLELENRNHFYYFTLDDDLIYPPGYVWKLIEKIEQYKRSAVVGVHGKTLPDQVDSFYKCKKLASCHTSSEIKRDQVVNCIGTGTMAFHSSTIDFGIEDIEAPNMADIWFSRAASRQNVPLICIERPKKWVKIQDVPDTIWEKHRDDCDLQTQTWNEHGNWELKTKYLKR